MWPQTAMTQDLGDFSINQQEIDPFAALLSRRGPSAVRLTSREPQLYETAEGDIRFTFQVSQQSGLIRFHCPSFADTLECQLIENNNEEEVFRLDATRSPRGDVIYKNDNEQAVLRVTATGGATLFHTSNSANSDTENEAFAGYSGVAASGQAVLPVSGLTSPMNSGGQEYEFVQRRIRSATQLLTLRHDLLLVMEAAPAETSGGNAVLAEAVLTVAKAIDLVAADELGKSVIKKRLSSVVFTPSVAAGHLFEGSTLTIFYNPDLDVAGRPSSSAIANYLEGVL